MPNPILLVLGSFVLGGLAGVIFSGPLKRLLFGRRLEYGDDGPNGPVILNIDCSQQGQISVNGTASGSNFWDLKRLYTHFWEQQPGSIPTEPPAGHEEHAAPGGSTFNVSHPLPANVTTGWVVVWAKFEPKPLVTYLNSGASQACVPGGGEEGE